MEPKGRKFWLTVVYLALATGFMIGSYALAWAGKLDPGWTQLGVMYLPTVAFATIGFQFSNAYVTAKAVSAKGDVAVAVAESPIPTVAAAATTRSGPPPIEEAHE
jgi:hypothetical protein